MCIITILDGDYSGISKEVKDFSKESVIPVLAEILDRDQNEIKLLASSLSRGIFQIRTKTEIEVYYSHLG